MNILTRANRQATQEQDEDFPRHSQGQGWREEGEEISGWSGLLLTMMTMMMTGYKGHCLGDREWRFLWNYYCSACCGFFIMVGTELRLRAWACLATIAWKTLADGHDKTDGV